jgi:uncharacterized protein (DUF2147 family)
VDDKSGEIKSHIEIYEVNGRVFGKVVKILDPESPANAICQDCEGEYKDQPILGLEIMKDFKKSGKYYKNGTILDPENGTEYDCKIWLNENDGNKLNVRGYVLFLYRTQEWIRLE